MKKITNLVLLLLSLLLAGTDYSLQVGENGEYLLRSKQGNLIGAKRKARNGDEFFAFLGIPYAEAPVGDLRFRNPANSVPFWAGDRPALEDADECLQNPPYNATAIVGDEDCLFVNVFTKHPAESQKDKLRPVLIWIHGGAFIFGGAKLYTVSVN